jgi:hypothetical protein
LTPPLNQYLDVAVHRSQVPEVLDVVTEVRQAPDHAVDDSHQMLEVEVHVFLGLWRLRPDVFRIVVPAV